MNKITLLITIIVFILNTGNVFSNNIIFTVNNIVVDGKINSEKDRINLLDKAFQKGFDEFTAKTLLTKDKQKLSDISNKSIKNLIFSYQIVKDEISINNTRIFTVNIKFDQEKINRYLITKNIPYADVSEITLTILPILIKENDVYLYSDNYFYTHWINDIEDKKKLIIYNLALENIEDLEYISKNKENLELINTENIFADYGGTNYALAIINLSGENSQLYIKTNIQNYKINKNLQIEFDSQNETKSYEEIIYKIKKEINQIWKNQNLIDINTPSFINLTLEIKKKNDLLSLKTILEKIDVIDNFSVVLLNNNFAKINVKYLGKISKIKNKLIEKNIKIKIINNEWKLKIN